MRTGKTPKDVDEYLAGVPEPARATLSKVRAVIRSAAPPEATEAISYGLATFFYKGPLLAYGAFSSHCGLYPMNSSVIATFEKELRGYSTSKGTIRFAVDKPLPTGLLKKIVKARVAQNELRKTR